jgi:hypothetical protein
MGRALLHRTFPVADHDVVDAEWRTAMGQARA